MRQSFHPLRVRETRQETADAASFVFEVPEDLRDTFRWRPGQHITLRVPWEGGEERRSYSISSSPYTGDPLRITVKRLPGGRISNHLLDTVRPGTVLDVMAPFGGFCLDPVATAHRTHYLFGAGSGITPLFAMLTSVLAAEPRSYVKLLYGNRNAKSILFSEELRALEETHGDRLTVVHALSSPSIWSSSRDLRTVRGHIDGDAVARFIDRNPPYAQDTQYYLCGPDGMNVCVQHALLNLDVPRERIHQESFGATPGEIDDSVTGVAANVTVRFGEATETVRVSAGETILTALRNAGIRTPYSCQAGVCSACKAHLVAGRVHLRAHMALDDEEIAAGAILTCQALPMTGDVSIRFDG